MDILILIGSFTVVCLMGMPVAYALGIASILGALYTGIPLEAVMLKVAGGMSGFSLLAIPFFILTGAIMAVGGMAERLINLAKVFVGAIRGGMALVNIVASTMFGCISGSSVADTAAVGGVMIPQMIKMGYPRLFAVNVTISGSLQPLLVPPSHNMIIYSIAAGGTVSVAHLFISRKASRSRSAKSARSRSTPYGVWSPSSLFSAASCPVCLHRRNPARSRASTRSL
jgi:tripartite ATP-independent transporter DctM subunit